MYGECVGRFVCMGVAESWRVRGEICMRKRSRCGREAYAHLNSASASVSPSDSSLESARIILTQTSLP